MPSFSFAQLVALAVLAPALVMAQSQAVIRPGGSDQRCVQPKHGSMVEGTQLVLGQCNGATEQAFSLADGVIHIYSDMCVVAGDVHTTIAKCNLDDRSQQWTYDTSSETFQSATGSCLNIASGKTAVGEPVGTAKCKAGADSQKWKVGDATDAPESDIPIAPPDESTPPSSGDDDEELPIDVPTEPPAPRPSSPSSSTPAHSHTAPEPSSEPSTPAHTHTVAPAPEPSSEPSPEPPVDETPAPADGVTIRSATKKNLCLAAAENKDGAALVTKACDGNASTQWSFEKKGSVTTLRVFGDKCVDVTDGRNEVGNALQIWTCVSGGSNQMFEQKNSQLVWHFFEKCIGTAGSTAQLADCGKAQRWVVA